MASTPSTTPAHADGLARHGREAAARTLYDAGSDAHSGDSCPR